MYITTEFFKDLADEGRVYPAGALFPAPDAPAPGAARLEYLAGRNNARGRAVIVALQPEVAQLLGMGKAALEGAGASSEELPDSKKADTAKKKAAASPAKGKDADTGKGAAAPAC